MARVPRLCAANRRARQSRAAAARPDRPRHRERRQAAVHRQYAVPQHDSRRRPGADARQSGRRAPHQEPGPLECRRDGRQGEQGGRGHRRSHLDVRVGRHALRSRLQPFLPRTRRRPRRRHLLSGSRGAWCLRPGVPGRTDRRVTPGEFPPRAESGRRAVVVSPSLADARLLGIPHGVDGSRSADGDLSGAVHAVPRGSRPQAEVERQDLGVSRRRRNRRARSAGRDHPAGARKAGQPDLRRQLQPPAPRRSGARQRPDHSRAGSRVSWCRLERDQGDLGTRVGSAAGQGSRRSPGQTHG